MPDFFNSGVITVNGVFTAVGLLVMILFALYYTAKKRYDGNLLMLLIPVMIFAGFAGARLLYVTVLDQLYIDASDKWKLTDGGYAFFGAVSGVVIVLLLYYIFTKNKRRVMPLIDTLCISAPAALAIGRMSSIFTGKYLGETIENKYLRVFPIAVYSAEENAYCLAVFFYEAVYCLAIFIFLNVIDKKLNKKGAVSYLFAVLYCGGRCFFESLREDKLIVGFVPVSQSVSFLTLIGLFIFMSVKLARFTGFKKKYIIYYVFFVAALSIAFYNEFFMYSTSKMWNTVQIFVCCIAMTVLAVLIGREYYIKHEKHERRLRRRTAESDDEEDDEL